ncbi:MauE/DoxX family redox-associated membrane protein [Kitasatospora sp. NPDC057692]|uniref:MauE/DoxX family redox-associated membrane protein n=1 Tax=Kitasatospora sp. NPDC057692 TaxID=3346215 RepID=UPI00368EA4E7
MWWFDALTSGFSSTTHDAQLQYVRIVVGLACLMKFIGSFPNGGWNRLDPGTYSRYLLIRGFGPRTGALVCRYYRPVLVVRLLSSLALTVGLAPNLAAAAVALGLVFELSYLNRFNTIYLALLCAALCCAGNLGAGIPNNGHDMSNKNTWAQFLIVLVTTNMYWNSAWIKARSEHFRSGLLLAQWVQTGARVRERLPYREFYYPRFIVQRIGNTGPASLQFWRTVAWAVIALEFIVPIGLCFGPLRPFAIAAGVAMHLCFTALLPRGLVGFSLGSIASYFAFVG